MKLILAMLCCGFTLAACQTSNDPFCRAHNAADLTPTREAYRTMSPAARREAEGRLQEAARRCGWEP